MNNLFHDMKNHNRRNMGEEDASSPQSRFYRKLSGYLNKAPHPGVAAAILLVAAAGVGYLISIGALGQ